MPSTEMSPDRFIGEVVGIAELISLHIDVSPRWKAGQVRVAYKAERKTVKEELYIEAFGHSLGEALRNAREELRATVNE